LGKTLIGKQEIKAYTRRSWQTILAWIETENFPARKETKINTRNRKMKTEAAIPDMQPVKGDKP
jgi:hypothetical protein